jgi:dihydrofolate reductase/thymidylate synthase
MKYKINRNSYKMIITIIVCVDMKYGFAKNGTIPWKIDEDMNLFQDVTTRKSFSSKNAVIMGKNTWLSLPAPLKNRINIVVSKTLHSISADYLVKEFDDAIDICKEQNSEQVFIIGGYEIYRQALEKSSPDYIYITKINYDYQCDLFFPQELIPSSYVNEYNKLFNVFDKTLGSFVNIKFMKKSLRSKTCVNSGELQYQELLERVLLEGDFRKTRNGNTYSLFGQTLRYDLRDFPLLTTKRVSLYNIFHELMFFLRGDTNTKVLSEKGIKIWEKNTIREFLDSMNLTIPEGDMGKMYGYQWRTFNKGENSCGFDQLQYCIDLLKTDPYSRRILMTSYNPLQAKEGCLFPCHGITIQFYVSKDRLSCSMTQRSGDLFLGIPYNIASYALLTYMMCEIINNDESSKMKLVPGELLLVINDVHIYESHYTQAIRQIMREPFEFPKLMFDPSRKVTNITDFQFEDITLQNYAAYPNIRAEMVA